MSDKQTWCNARKIPYAEQNTKWVNDLYELSMQVKDQSIPAKKAELQRHIYAILAEQRIKCQQTLHQKGIQHVLPIFTRVEQIFAHLNMAQQPPKEKEQKNTAKTVDLQAKNHRRLKQQEAEQFQEKWAPKLNEIAENFPPGETVELPSEPYQPKDITTFIEQAKPLVRRNNIRVNLIMLGSFVGICTGLYLDLLEESNLVLFGIIGAVLTEVLWRFFR